MSKIEELPATIEHEIEYEDGSVENHLFFLNINRDLYGKWSCGYVHYAHDDEGEMAIPQLVTNSSDSLNEAAIRMAAKLERYKKLLKS